MSLKCKWRGIGKTYFRTFYFASFYLGILATSNIIADLLF